MKEIKTTLCLNCEFGLVREWEYYDTDLVVPRSITGRQNKCLLSNDIVEVITICNRYKKVDNRVTYHDPEFAEYEKKVSEE